MEAFAAGSETAWQARHTEGCDAPRLGWKTPACHRVEAAGVLALFDSAVAWQIWQFWKVSWLDVCFIVKLTPLERSDLAVSAIKG